MYGASEHTWSVTSVACTLYDIVPCLTSTAGLASFPDPAQLSVTCSLCTERAWERGYS